MQVSTQTLLQLTLTLALALQVSAAYSSTGLDDTPVFNKTYIAIITQPNTEYHKYTNDTWTATNSYIASSYVKYVEQGGAVPVLIPWDLPFAQMTKYLKEVNGVLLPGGSAKLLNSYATPEVPTTYMYVIDKIIRFAKQQNDQGRFFSIWGECLGFEEMLVSLSNLNPMSITSGFDDVDQVHSVKVNTDLFKRSKLFGQMDYYKSMYVLGKDRLYYHHVMGTTPENFMADPVLSKTMDILGTSVAPNGKVYVAIMKHKTYPFYGLQSHPEKNQFENKNPHVDIADRSSETLDVTSGFIRACVEENRVTRNYQSSSDRTTTAFDAYNHLSIPFLGETFESIYMFPTLGNCVNCQLDIATDQYMESVYQSYKMVKAAKVIYDQEVMTWATPAYWASVDGDIDYSYTG